MVERGSNYRKFKTPPARTACTSCRASRVRCSGTGPCLRCAKTGRLCVFTCPQRRKSPSAAVQDSSRNPARNDANSTTINVVDEEELAALDVTNDFEPKDFAFLPPLFNDNVDAFQFDDIFLGDTETELNSFFADIFSLPTFPRQDFEVPASVPTSTLQPLVHGYHSDAEVLQTYYHLIHPIFPVLPPPVEEVVNDFYTSNATTYMPSSPLILALLGLLNHLSPRSDADQDEMSRQNRVNLSQQMVHLALEAVDNMIPMSLLELDDFESAPYHRNFPSQLEMPMTHCVLSLYEYLCWGNIDQMTRLAQKAVAFFDNIIRVTETLSSTVSRFDEALRRAWWMAYLCTCNASTVSCKPPAEPVDVASVRIPYPTVGDDRDIWGHFIRAEESIVAATLLQVALVKGFGTRSAVPSFHRSLHLLGGLINHQLSNLPVASTSHSDMASSPEIRLASCFQTLTRVRLNSARIKVHRYRAFMSDPRILGKFGEISSSRTASKSLGSATTDAVFSPSTCSIFPFTETYARKVCVDSASMIAHDLQQQLAAGTIAAHSVCSAMIAGYTLMMMWSSNLAGNASLDEQRETQTQCQVGVKAAMEVLCSYGAGSGFLKGLRDQLQIAATACKIC